MTPDERIAAALTGRWGQLPAVIIAEALDALCPKGERVVLDRTRDTDRLADLGEVLTKIRAAMQKSAAYAEGDSDDYSVAGAVAHGEAASLRWVLDLFEDGPDE